MRDKCCDKKEWDVAFWSNEIGSESQREVRPTANCKVSYCVRNFELTVSQVVTLRKELDMAQAQAAKAKRKMTHLAEDSDAAAEGDKDEEKEEEVKGEEEEEVVSFCTVFCGRAMN